VQDGLGCLSHFLAVLRRLGLSRLQIPDGGFFIVDEFLSHLIQERLGASGGILAVGALLVWVAHPAALSVNMTTFTDGEQARLEGVVAAKGLHKTETQVRHLEV